MKLVVFVLPIILFCRCITPQKITQFIDWKYQEKSDSIIVQDYFSIDTSAHKWTEDQVEYEVIKSQFIPTIVYFQWDRQYNFELGENQNFKTFNNKFSFFMDSLKINEKLNGRKLILNIESVPNSITYRKTGSFLFLVLAYSMRSLEVILPKNESLIFSYQLIVESDIIKSGKIEIENKDIPYKKGFNTSKNFIWDYIDKHERNLTRLTRRACLKLAEEI